MQSCHGSKCLHSLEFFVLDNGKVYFFRFFDCQFGYIGRVYFLSFVSVSLDLVMM